MKLPGFDAEATLPRTIGHGRNGGAFRSDHEKGNWISAASESQPGEVINIHGCGPGEIRLGEGNNTVCINPGLFWNDQRGNTVLPTAPPPHRGGGGSGGGTPPPIVTFSTVCTPCTAFNLLWCHDRTCTSTGASQSCVDGPLRQEDCFYTGPLRPSAGDIVDMWLQSRGHPIYNPDPL